MVDAVESNIDEDDVDVVVDDDDADADADDDDGMVCEVPYTVADGKEGRWDVSCDNDATPFCRRRRWSLYLSMYDWRRCPLKCALLSPLKSLSSRW